MNSIDQDALDYYQKKFPERAISMRPFLGGTQSECGFVPNDWNGIHINVGDPWAEKRKGSAKGYR